MTLDLKPGPESLKAISLSIGIIFLAIGIFSLMLADMAKTFWQKLPRSIWIGRILTAFCLIWAMLWLFLMPMGFLDITKLHLWWLTPVAIVATCLLLPDLLACRAIGGLFVLIPAPMFSSAAWHPSTSRYLIIVLGYVFVLVGMFYIAMPWLLRDNITWALKTPTRFKICTMAFTVLGAIICTLALTHLK